MSPERQRIKIAELRGWGWRYHNGKMMLFDPGFFSKNPSFQRLPLVEWPDVELAATTPDYLNDLNAMHEAFGKLGRHWEICQVGDGYLCRIQFGPRNKDVAVAGLELIPVMAEAFLRTMNAWEDAE